MTTSNAHATLVIGLNGKVAGIDRASGELKWDNGMKGGGGAEVTLAIGEGVVIASASSNKIFCLDYETGAERWTADHHNPARASIIIDAGMAYVAKQGVVIAYHIATGEKAWTQHLKGFGFGKIAMGVPGNVQQADA